MHHAHGVNLAGTQTAGGTHLIHLIQVHIVCRDELQGIRESCLSKCSCNALNARSAVHCASGNRVATGSHLHTKPRQSNVCDIITKCMFTFNARRGSSITTALPHITARQQTERRCVRRLHLSDGGSAVVRGTGCSGHGRRCGSGGHGAAAGRRVLKALVHVWAA